MSNARRPPRRGVPPSMETSSDDLRRDAPAQSRRKRAWRGPALLALLYVIVFFVYIDFSGQVVARMSTGVGELEALERAKGFVFVLVNGVGLFSAALIYRRRLERSRGALEVERAVVARFDRHLEALHDGLPSALMVFDVLGPGLYRVKRSNPAIARLLGTTRERLDVGDTEPIASALGRERWKELVADLDRCVASGKPGEREFTLATPSGQSSFLQHVAPLVDAQGVVESVFATLHDTSLLRANERRMGELEEELRHSQRLLTMGELASGVAHDVNNLLTVIATHADLLQRALAGRPELERSLEVIDSAVQKASGISRTLLGFSRKIKGHAQVIPLVPLVLDICELLERTLPKAVRLEFDLSAAEGLAVDGDRIQIQQVLMNLILNARDAMPRGGSVRLLAEHVPGPPERVRLCVEDDGGGISDTVLARAFEPFFTTKAADRGSGLGLSLARRIAREHDGDVLLENVEPHGTRAVFELPTVHARPGASVKPSVLGQWIALLEAQPQVRAILAGELVGLGYRVELSDDANQMAERVATDEVDPSLLIVDQPTLRSSLATLEELRERGLRQPALLMALEIPPERFMRASGPVHVLRKPFGVAEFARMKREALEPAEAPR